MATDCRYCCIVVVVVLIVGIVVIVVAVVIVAMRVRVVRLFVFFCGFAYSGNSTHQQWLIRLHIT